MMTPRKTELLVHLGEILDQARAVTFVVPDDTGFFSLEDDLVGQVRRVMQNALDLMRELGFTDEDFRIRVSDRNAWVQFAESAGIEGEALTTFLQVIDKMERAPEEKTAAQLADLGLTLERVREFIGSGAEANSTTRSSKPPQP